jgi:hypothetical protein
MTKGLLWHYGSTLKHKAWVAWFLLIFCVRLFWRAIIHDWSKFRKVEADEFGKVIFLLRDTTYGTDQYRELLRRTKPAIDAHYKVNTHHPEHWPEGMAGMDLLDLVELAYDWKAAAKRHKDGNITRSIDQNAERFGYSSMLTCILKNALEDKRGRHIHHSHSAE